MITMSEIRILEIYKLNVLLNIRFSEIHYLTQRVELKNMGLFRKVHEKLLSGLSNLTFGTIISQVKSLLEQLVSERRAKCIGLCHL